MRVDGLESWCKVVRLVSDDAHVDRFMISAVDLAGWKRVAQFGKQIGMRLIDFQAWWRRMCM
jgi:hypothetical protein